MVFTLFSLTSLNIVEPERERMGAQQIGTLARSMSL